MRTDGECEHLRGISRDSSRQPRRGPPNLKLSRPSTVLRTGRDAEGTEPRRTRSTRRAEGGAVETPLGGGNAPRCRPSVKQASFGPPHAPLSRPLRGHASTWRCAGLMPEKPRSHPNAASRVWASNPPSGQGTTGRSVAAGGSGRAARVRTQFVAGGARPHPCAQSAHCRPPPALRSSCPSCLRGSMHPGSSGRHIVAGPANRHKSGAAQSFAAACCFRFPVQRTTAPVSSNAPRGLQATSQK